jgi:HSP20 family molecular chaperone IbpA
MESSTSSRAKPHERAMDRNILEAAGENLLDRCREDLRDIHLDLELFEREVGSRTRPRFPSYASEGGKGEKFAPLYVEDLGTTFEARANVPGVPRELVAIQFFDPTRVIEAESKAVRETERKAYVLKERAETEYYRRVNFPSPVLPGRTDAKLENGDLVVTVPRQKPAKEHRVRVG